MSVAQDDTQQVCGGAMTEASVYAQPLRAIGQALETLHLQSFELEPVGAGFYVRGDLATPRPGLSEAQVTPDQLNAIWGELSGFDLENGIAQSTPSAAVLTTIELQYTTQDLDRLEKEGQTKRVDPRRMPDTSSLSQILRCVDAYLSQKRVRLLKLWRDTESVSIEYETSLGNQLKETLALGELYDLWVRMYMQRSERAIP